VEEAVVTVCIAVSKKEIVGKFNTGRERERERESKRDKRQLMRGLTLDTSPKSRDIMIANGIKVFKCCLLNVCKREYRI
jgi:hypothetical protein